MTEKIYIKQIIGACCCFLLIPSIIAAQSGFINQVKEQFSQYQKNNLQEKLFVHTDKTFYLAGEQLWFKVYIVDAVLNRPLDISKVAYIEIIDKESRPVLQTKVSVDEAMGNGSFSLPAYLPSGSYTLRAYTQWMKNFSAAFFYEQPVTIVNTIRENSLPQPGHNNTVDFQFFPEGGNLVAALNSTIGYKATDKNGEGINCNGIIVNQKKDTVARFKSLSSGIGSFSFTPNKDDQYKAIVKTVNDSSFEKEIPKIYPEGYVMQLLETDSEHIIITVSSTTGFNNLPVYLFGHSHHLIKTAQASQLTNSKAFFIVNKGDLTDGVSHFTIFNNNRQPVCERLYFKQPESKLTLQLTTEKEIYNTREKVNVSISAYNTAQTALQANLSMSVFLVDSLQSAAYTDILSYLLLTADLDGKTESPQVYFDDKNKDAAAMANNLMLTQGWRRFNWENILQDKNPYFEFLPDYEGLAINAKVTNRKSNQPVPGINTFLSIPGRNFQFINSISNKEGKVRFGLGKCYGNNDIILQANNDKDSIYSFDIDNPYSNKFSTKYTPYYNITENVKKDLLNRHIALQAENTYNTTLKKIYNSYKNPDSTAFYGLPMHSFALDGFTRFNTMEEVIKEFITDVKLRKKDNEFVLKVFDRQTQSYFNNNPLVLIDGNPIFDFNKIVAFNPLKIESIDVVSEKFHKGATAYDGIISCKTYGGDLGGYTLDAGAVVLKFDGLQQQREFYTPLYENADQKSSRIPDLRNLLKWDPSITTDITGKATVSFFTSDLKGKFAVTIQGITKDGKAGSSLLFFNVVK
jgi:hypothetical protein